MTNKRRRLVQPASSDEDGGVGKAAARDESTSGSEGSSSEEGGSEESDSETSVTGSASESEDSSASSDEADSSESVEDEDEEEEEHKHNDKKKRLLKRQKLRRMHTNKAVLQDRERTDLAFPDSKRFEPKPMVELKAGSNIWYQAYVIKESANEVKIEVPGVNGKRKPLLEWLKKGSSRIWRGSLRAEHWRHLGKGSWEPKAGSALEDTGGEGVAPITSRLRPAGHLAGHTQPSISSAGQGAGEPLADPLTRWFVKHISALATTGMLCMVPEGSVESGALPPGFIYDHSTRSVVLQPPPGLSSTHAESAQASPVNPSQQGVGTANVIPIAHPAGSNMSRHAPLPQQTKEETPEVGTAVGGGTRGAGTAAVTAAGGQTGGQSASSPYNHPPPLARKSSVGWAVTAGKAAGTAAKRLLDQQQRPQPVSVKRERLDGKQEGGRAAGRAGALSRDGDKGKQEVAQHQPPGAGAVEKRSQGKDKAKQSAGGEGSGAVARQNTAGGDDGAVGGDKRSAKAPVSQGHTSKGTAHGDHHTPSPAPVVYGNAVADGDGAPGGSSKFARQGSEGGSEPRSSHGGEQARPGSNYTPGAPRRLSNPQQPSPSNHPLINSSKPRDADATDEPANHHQPTTNNHNHQVLHPPPRASSGGHEEVRVLEEVGSTDPLTSLQLPTAAGVQQHSQQPPQQGHAGDAADGGMLARRHSVGAVKSQQGDGRHASAGAGHTQADDTSKGGAGSQLPTNASKDINKASASGGGHSQRPVDKTAGTGVRDRGGTGGAQGGGGSGNGKRANDGKGGQPRVSPPPKAARRSVIMVEDSGDEDEPSRQPSAGLSSPAAGGSMPQGESPTGVALLPAGAQTSSPKGTGQTSRAPTHTGGTGAGIPPPPPVPMQSEAPARGGSVERVFGRGTSRPPSAQPPPPPPGDRPGPGGTNHSNSTHGKQHSRDAPRAEAITRRDSDDAQQQNSKNGMKASSPGAAPVPTAAVGKLGDDGRLSRQSSGALALRERERSPSVTRDVGTGSKGKAHPAGTEETRGDGAATKVVPKGKASPALQGRDSNGPSTAVKSGSVADGDVAADQPPLPPPPPPRLLA